MANYRTHTLLNLAVALPASIAAGACLGVARPLLGIFSGIFAYGTLFANPDLDLAYQTKLWSLRGILAFPFRGYARLFRHRGLSHSFIFGTLTRLLWVAMYVAAFMFLVYSARPTDSLFLNFVKRYQEPLIAGLLGLVIADWGHLIVDKIWDLRHKS